MPSLGARRVEDPDHDLLAEQRRQRADAKVDRLVAELQLHPAVLRHALLGDVEARDDLDARRQLVLDRERRLRDLAQLAVDAEADAVVVLVGLEVQVGGAQVDRVDQHLLQEADDRRVLDLGATSAASAGWLVTSSVTSNSKSPEDSDSIASLALAPVVSSSLRRACRARR